MFINDDYFLTPDLLTSPPPPPDTEAKYVYAYVVDENFTDFKRPELGITFMDPLLVVAFHIHGTAENLNLNHHIILDEKAKTVILAISEPGRGIVMPFGFEGVPIPEILRHLESCVQTTAQPRWIPFDADKMDVEYIDFATQHEKRFYNRLFGIYRRDSSPHPLRLELGL